MGQSGRSVGRESERTAKVDGPEIKQWTVRQLDGDLNESGRSERTQSLDMSHLGHLDKLDGHFQREHQLSRDRPLSSAWTVYFRLDSISTL